MAATANHWRILSNFDLVIFDEAEVRDRASYENSHRYAAGICRQDSIALGIRRSGSRNGGGGNRILSLGVSVHSDLFLPVDKYI